jgi:mycothiol system anti-sigma-R factor
MHNTQVDCHSAMAQLWDFLDEELTDERMTLVHRHLDECALCHPHAAFARQFLGALRRCRSADPMPETLRERVIETLRSAGLLA